MLLSPFLIDLFKETAKTNSLRNAELSREQNCNMIDGILNNEPPTKADLTDGQTYDEILELAPETLRDDADFSILDKLRQKQDSLGDLFPAAKQDKEERQR